MRTVYEAANLVDAHLVRLALEQEGIPVFVRGEALVGGIGELGVFGLVAVMVPEAAWPEARAQVDALALGSESPGKDSEHSPGEVPWPGS